MSMRGNRRSYLFKTGIILLVLLFFTLSVHAQETSNAAGSNVESFEKSGKRNFVLRCVDFIERFLEQDTAYVSPNRFNLSVMPQYSYNYEYYNFATEKNAQSISIVPTFNHKAGLYFGWRWLFLGYSFDISKSRPETDLSLELYCSRGGIEVFYRKRSDGYRINGLKGFEKDGVPLTGYDKEFDGFSVTQGGGSFYYIFNSRKFSFPAAYRQSTNQRKSAGSLLLGISYNDQRFMCDSSRIDADIRERMCQELKFQEIGYKEISLNLGYSYNWVFAKDFLANITIIPAIGYKNTSLKFYKNSSEEFVPSINFDLISRLAIVYNNSWFYAGASLKSHRYSYNKAPLSVMNGLGSVNVYVGINFWRRKR